jgi:hypothetical protein
LINCLTMLYVSRLGIPVRDSGKSNVSSFAFSLKQISSFGETNMDKPE